jgi:hypothetical protein
MASERKSQYNLSTTVKNVDLYGSFDDVPWLKLTKELANEYGMSEDGLKFAWNKYSNLLLDNFNESKPGENVVLEDIIDQTLRNVMDDIEIGSYVDNAGKEHDDLAQGDFGYYAELLYTDDRIRNDGTIKGLFFGPLLDEDTF